MNIFVVCASFLGDYDYAAKNRKMKFLRAVDSFLSNDYENKKLIIVSDGCDVTNELYNKYYLNNEKVIKITIDKQEKFSGNVRQAGIEHINNNGSPLDIICYLDTDDKITSTHLSSIVKQFNDNEIVYYNDYLYINKNEIILRPSEIQYGKIGTSSIAHLNKPEYNWAGCDGYGHDFIFIQKIIKLTNKYNKIYGCGYCVMHVPNQIDN